MAVERRRTGRLHPSGRSVSGGRRQPSLLPREECGTAAGEEGRRSRCRPRQVPAPDQPWWEAVSALHRHCRQRSARAVGASPVRSTPPLRHPPGVMPPSSRHNDTRRARYGSEHREVDAGAGSAYW